LFDNLLSGRCTAATLNNLCGATPGCKLDNRTALVSNVRRGDPVRDAAGLPLRFEIS
jgi:hypothetical protein